MNGILCAYLRATDAEHAERRRHGVAAALDRQLHDVLGVEVRRVRRERRAGRVLDALIDRQDRHVAGARQPAVCRTATAGCASTRGGRSELREDAVDEIGARQVQRLLRDRLALVLEQAGARRRESSSMLRADLLATGMVVTSLRDLGSILPPGKSKSSTTAAVDGAVAPFRRSAASAPPPRSSSQPRAASPGCRGVNSVQQSWSGMIEIG